MINFKNRPNLRKVSLECAGGDAAGGSVSPRSEDAQSRYQVLGCGVTFCGAVFFPRVLMPMPLIKSAYKSLAAAVPESCAFCVLPSVAEPYQIKAGGGAFLCIP